MRHKQPSRKARPVKVKQVYELLLIVRSEKNYDPCLLGEAIAKAVALAGMEVQELTCRRKYAKD